MIRDRTAPRLWCLRCGGPHINNECVAKLSNTPLETPSHNGVYRGTCQVRHIPPATYGEYRDNPTFHATTFSRPVYDHLCHQCKQPFKSERKIHHFCTRPCRDKNHYERRPDKGHR